MKMPWGIHKDKEIHEIPSKYLFWIARDWKEDSNLIKRIVKEADKEWQWREKNNQHWEE